MSLLTKKPVYASQELSERVSDLQTLTHLRDEAIKASRLYSKENTDYVAEIRRYSQNIATCQMVLERMYEKVLK